MTLSLIVVAAILAVVFVTQRSGTSEPVERVVPVERQAVEIPVQPRDSEASGGLEVDDEAAPVPRASGRQAVRSGPQGESAEYPLQPEESTTPEGSLKNLPPPTPQEIEAATRPRQYAANDEAVLTLTIPAINIYDAPVLNSMSSRALSAGIIHVPQTPMPWTDRRQKNVYLAGHRLGYVGTGSRLIFFNLDKLREGDEVLLRDRSGNAYRYRVSEIFVVSPSAGWVVDTVRDRDILTLQTCTYPSFENRLIVRADRV